MPRIALTKPQKIANQIKQVSEDAMADCKKHGVKVYEVADVLGVHYTAISHQFKNKKITLATYLAVQLLVNEKGE